MEIFKTFKIANCNSFLFPFFSEKVLHKRNTVGNRVVIGVKQVQRLATASSTRRISLELAAIVNL